jgi:hypothetical protein
MSTDGTAGLPNSIITRPRVCRQLGSLLGYCGPRRRSAGSGGLCKGPRMPAGETGEATAS